MARMRDFMVMRRDGTRIYLVPRMNLAMLSMGLDLPADARYRTAYWCAERDALAIVVEHASFTVIPDGGEIPFAMAMPKQPGDTSARM